MTSTIKVDNIQNQCGANIINESANTITIGASGDTVSLPSGVTLSGVGTVSWDTTAKTASFTAVSGNGYFVNTTSGAITVTLPASPSAGDIVAVSDYAQTSETNNITIARNGSNIQGDASDLVVSNTGVALTLIYVDATKGWIVTNSGSESDKNPEPVFTVATGGTITCCGDFKIHTFTGPGTFCVSQIGNGPISPTGGPSNVDYLVVAGGGAGGGGGTPHGGSGGGAGGHRTTFPSPGCNAGSFPITAAAFPITVGGGGPSPGGNSAQGGSGSNSVFSTITSAGGGGGGQTSQRTGPLAALPGGSGGGAGADGVNGGTGNSPPVSPPQGNDGGGSGTSNQAGGGGGGIGGTGTPAPSATGGLGGPGSANSITGSPVTRAGGGSGGGNPGGRPGTPGGGGSSPGGTGTDNTGGGGGGGTASSNSGGNGGSGIVIIRYKFQ